MTSRELGESLIGLNYELASYAMWAVGIPHRILYRDDSPYKDYVQYIHTRDYKPERINIGLRYNTVIEVKFG